MVRGRRPFDQVDLTWGPFVKVGYRVNVALISWRLHSLTRVVRKRLKSFFLAYLVLVSSTNLFSVDNFWIAKPYTRFYFSLVYVLPLHIDAESLPFFSAYYTLHSWRVLYASDPVHSFGPFSDRNFGFCQLSRQHAKGVDRRKCRLKGAFQVRGIKMHLKCKVFRSYYQHYPSAPLMRPKNGVKSYLKEHSYFFTPAL